MMKYHQVDVLFIKVEKKKENKKEYIIVHEYVDKAEVYVFDNNLNIYTRRMI